MPNWAELRGLLIDLDGVVYTGRDPIPGAAGFLAAARRRGLPFLLITNNSTTSPELVAERLGGMHIDVEPHEILTSGQAAVAYVRAHSTGRARLRVIGEAGLRQAAEAEGLEVVGDDDDHVEWVVAGLDRAFDYAKLTAATRAILDGAHFVATNADALLPVEGGNMLPGAGSIIAAIQTATAVEPIVVGKPEPGLFEHGLIRLGGLQPSDVAMIGDRLDTDVVGARRAGLRSILVLSGVTTARHVAESTIECDAVVPDLAAVAGLLGLEYVIRWQELSAQGHGVRLHVRQMVEPEAPPVLLLHGLGVGGSIWQAFARRLSPQLAAVAPDLRGHGQSDAPVDGYAPSDYARDISDLIDDLRLPTPVPVVGHSLGALVALSLAALKPDLISWLALLDPPLDPEHRNPEIAQVYRLRSAEPGALERYLLERNPGGGQLLAQALASLFRQAADGAFEALLQHGSDPLPAVDRLAAPCLLLQADPDHGGVLGDEAAAAVTERLPKGSALVKIDGAAHALHASHPAEVADAILRFGGYVSSVSSSSR